MMKWIKGLLSFLWRSWFVLMGIIATLIFGIFLVLPFSYKENHYKHAYFFMRWWAIFIFFSSGLRIKKHGFEEFDVLAPYIIIGNHTSMMDIMVMLIVNKQPLVFVGKKELTNLPVFGLIYKKLNILVDRKNPNSRRKVYGDSIKKLNEGKSICIFPEGGVPDESVELDEFHNGAFTISIKAKVPLVTTTICGLKEILPYAYFKGRPGMVHVFLNNITYTENLDKLDIPRLKESSYNLIKRNLEKCNS